MIQVGKNLSPSRQTVLRDLDRLGWTARRYGSSLDAALERATKCDALCISGLLPVVASRTSAQTPALPSWPEPPPGTGQAAGALRAPDANQRTPI